MKVLHSLVVLLIFAFILALGLLMIECAVSPDWWSVISLQVVDATRWHLAEAGAALLVLAALLPLTSRRRRTEKERILSFRNEEGTISISTTAISDYVCRLSEEFPSVVKMQPRVIPHRGAIDLVVNLRVKAGPELHEVCEVLQRRVRETLVNGLGISEVRRVVVNVREISPEHKAE